MLQALDNSTADACLTRAEWQKSDFSPSGRNGPRCLPCRPIGRAGPLGCALIAIILSSLSEACCNASLPMHSSMLKSSTTATTIRLASRLLRIADVELIWLDFERYRPSFNAPALMAWLIERIRTLRSLSDAPILVTDSSAADDVVAVDFNRLLHQAGTMSRRSLSRLSRRLHRIWAPNTSIIGWRALPERPSATVAALRRPAPWGCSGSGFAASTP